VAGWIALPAFFLIVLAGYAGYRAPPAPQDRDSGSFRISVDVDLVVLHATVSDRQGGFVSNLGEGDFEVYEDGVPQSIRLFRNEDVPVTAGLIVDHSTSMRQRMPEVTAAAQAFVRSSNRDDEMFVVNFNERVYLGLPGAIRFTDNIPRGGSGTEPGCAQEPGTGHGRRSLSARGARRSDLHLRAHRSRHSPSVHHGICSPQPDARRRLSCHSGSGAG
jgi:hypothetical protein